MALAITGAPDDHESAATRPTSDGLHIRARFRAARDRKLVRVGRVPASADPCASGVDPELGELVPPIADERAAAVGDGELALTAHAGPG
jgi:hypothetical protein